MNTKFVSIILLFSTCNAFATGFNCPDSKNGVENLICSNDELSALDGELNALFKSVLTKEAVSSALRQEQRQWLVERNKCNDVPCLVRSYRNRALQLGSPENKKNTECPILEKDLLGTWRISGTGEFEEITFDLFEGRKVFMSWLHHHPEMPGTWSMVDCRLHIAHESEFKLMFDYKIKKYAYGSLSLVDESDVVSVYKRVK